MGTIFTPINQVKLTNVSIVRMKKAGKRFELACYKNKVQEWRNGVETDIDNVLQTHQIFVNVSKGQLAKKEDLEKAFETDNLDDCVKEILKKGELQVNQKEREAAQETMFTSIATIVSEKCVNPTTNRPYPVSMIEKTMHDTLHYSILPKKSAKQQALDVIRLIQSKTDFPIALAQMKVRVLLPMKEGKKILEKLKSLVNKIEEEDFSDEYEMICLIDPGKFRDINTLVQEETKGKGQLEVLSVSESAQSDEIL